ncbi:CDC42 small effector protein 1 isoform X1 [Oenanthe melanoleuca]|uniref:CDC42 small effector protein 1 isoform X1 n=1 Tax=Oenanthe melanoleuca TaxID=2939378 RepID=UPI0024C1C594|nr:CDC42 small effector protein 1 isoform X1 [Oenanthe melanoleuca]
MGSEPGRRLHGAGLGSPVRGLPRAPTAPRQQQEAQAGLWPIRRHRRRAGEGTFPVCQSGGSGTPGPCQRRGAGPWLPQGCAQPTGLVGGTASCSCPRRASPGRCPHGVTPRWVPAGRGDAGCHRRQHERLLAQAGLLRGGEAPAQEEEETDRPLHDRGAHELRAPDTHRLRRHGCRRGAAHDRCCPGDEVQGRPGATVEQLPCVVAYSWLSQPKLELPDPPRWRRRRPGVPEARGIYAAPSSPSSR